MQRRRNVFPFLIAMLMIICKLFLKNHQRTRTKFISYFQGFHIIAISENTSKYDTSDFKEDTYHGVPLQQIWMLKSTTFPKNLLYFFYFLSLANFIRIDIKNNSWWIAHIILSKALVAVTFLKGGRILGRDTYSFSLDSKTARGTSKWRLPS